MRGTGTTPLGEAVVGTGAPVDSVGGTGAAVERGAPWWPDDPQAASSTPAAQNVLQRRRTRVDAPIMQVARRYPTPPQDNGRVEALHARIAELEREITDLVARSPRSALVDDPVALTAALHPRGLQRRRPRAEGAGTLSLRFFVFEPSRDD